MTFRIGDKVRNMYNMNLIGTISAISMPFNASYINTIDVQLNDDHMLYECDPDNWELYFEVGDIVKHKSSGKVYQIYDYSSNDGFNLEHFSDAENRYTKFYYVLPDDIRMANDAEKSKFYKLKESYETKEKEKLDLTPLKEYLKECLNKKYGELYPIKASYPGHGGELSELSKELIKFKKAKEEKETKEMKSYKVGDIVKHPLYNESIIVDISEFETGYISIIPLTGLSRGQKILVSIDNIKPIDNKLIISVDDYNKMANTIENLKKEKVDLQEKVYNAYFGYKYKNLPEVKEVLYHKPATIIFWKDGTKTVVKAQNKEKYDKEKGFVMAYLKKILGNEGNYYEVIKRWTEV